jgi:hypothetical protein
MTTDQQVDQHEREPELEEARRQSESAGRSRSTAKSL